MFEITVLEVIAMWTQLFRITDNAGYRLLLLRVWWKYARCGSVYHENKKQL